MPVVNLQISLSEPPIVNAITGHALPAIALQHEQPLSFPVIGGHVARVEIFCHVLRFVDTIKV
jgi:hypothetical protein